MRQRDTDRKPVKTGRMLSVSRSPGKTWQNTLCDCGGPRMGGSEHENEEMERGLAAENGAA